MLARRRKAAGRKARSQGGIAGRRRNRNVQRAIEGGQQPPEAEQQCRRMAAAPAARWRCGRHCRSSRPPSPGASRSMSSTRRPSSASARAHAAPITPAPMTAIVSCCAIRLTYANWPHWKRFVMKEIRVIDSHTAGEPTRLVLEGGPPLGPGPLDARAARFRTEFDAWRSAIVNEPRGSDAMVGALLCARIVPIAASGSSSSTMSAFSMCGHGTIGVIATLAYRGDSRPGEYGSTRPWARWRRVV